MESFFLRSACCALGKGREDNSEFTSWALASPLDGSYIPSGMPASAATLAVSGIAQQGLGRRDVGKAGGWVMMGKTTRAMARLLRNCMAMMAREVNEVRKREVKVLQREERDRRV